MAITRFLMIVLFLCGLITNISAGSLLFSSAVQHIAIAQNSTPDIVYEFNQPDLASNGWVERPRGFSTQAETGQVFANTYVKHRIGSSQDTVGLNLTVGHNQLSFIHTLAPVETSAPVLMRLTLRSDSPEAAVTLAALKGNLTIGELVDGSIAEKTITSAGNAVSREYQLILLYEPESPEIFTPIIQIAATGNSTVSVLVDRLEIFILQSNAEYDGRIFNAHSEAAPDMQIINYEFNQWGSEGNPWTVRPNGFSTTPNENYSSQIVQMVFEPNLFLDSDDNTGIEISANRSDIVMLHGNQAVNTMGQSMLLRLTFRSDYPDAAVALGVLKGDLSTGSNVDGSISTNIPSRIDAFVDRSRRLVMLYNPEEQETVTPFVQVVGNGVRDSVKIYLDKLEIVPLMVNESYDSEIFASDIGPNVTPTPTNIIPTATPVIPTTPTPTVFLPTPSPTITPTFIPFTPTSTPTFNTVPTPAPTNPVPTPSGSGYQENEPNNQIGQPQMLAALTIGQSIQLVGNVSSGGANQNDYTGDKDYYLLTLTEQSDISIKLDWNNNSDLDLSLWLFGHNQVIDGDISTQKPVNGSATLNPGEYVILVASKDNPADYTLNVQITAPTTEIYPNDVSILNGAYDEFFWKPNLIAQGGTAALEGYVFDGQGNVEHYSMFSHSHIDERINWQVDQDLLEYVGTYEVVYPFLIIRHGTTTEYIPMSAANHEFMRVYIQNPVRFNWGWFVIDVG